MGPLTQSSHGHELITRCCLTRLLSTYQVGFGLKEGFFSRVNPPFAVMLNSPSAPDAVEVRYLHMKCARA
jgi:hypothetical protein